MTRPADWAINAALDRVYAKINTSPSKMIRDSILNPTKSRSWHVYLMLAEMIEKYEKPPVDPDLLRAREICNEEYGIGTYFLNGKYDDEYGLRACLRALKEGRKCSCSPQS